MHTDVFKTRFPKSISTDHRIYDNVWSTEIAEFCVHRDIKIIRRVPPPSSTYMLSLRIKSYVLLVSNYILHKVGPCVSDIDITGIIKHLQTSSFFTTMFPFAHIF
jgi:hypothetical protein